MKTMIGGNGKIYAVDWLLTNSQTTLFVIVYFLSQLYSSSSVLAKGLA
jgi:hypothetical protein